MAAAIGIELLTEGQYRELQKLGHFDSKTSSWVKTPADIRNSAEPSFVIVGTRPSLYITTVRSLTTLLGGSAVRSGFNRKADLDPKV